MREVEQIRQVAGRVVRVTRVWQASVGVAQLIEERMNHCLDSPQSLCWGILEERRDKINGLMRCPSENLED